MDKEIQQLFFSVKNAQPEADLFLRVMNGVRLAEKRRTERRLFLHLVAVSSSMFVFYYFLISTVTSLNETGFLRYSSLIFSDFEVVLASWQTYLLSLLETLPVTGLIVLFSASLVIMTSMKYVVEGFKNFLSLNTLIKQQKYVQ